MITAPLSAAYTALAIMMAGARPVFADIDPVRLTIDPRAIEAAITPRTAAIMPVHLYGQAADMPAILAIAERHGLAVVEDACQAHLATCGGRPVGTMGAAGALSFYPTKNLGALGDGGAVLTNDAALAERIRRLRNGGQSTRYHHDEFGVNSRLDEMQAAILRARLTRLPAWTARRRALAARYRAALAPVVAAGPALRVPPELDAGPRLPPVPGPGRRPRQAPGPPRRGRHRDADPLPGADPAAAGAGDRGPGAVPDRRPRLQRAPVVAALSRHAGRGGGHRRRRRRVRRDGGVTAG